MNRFRYLFLALLCLSLSAIAGDKYVKLVDDADNAVSKGEYTKAISLLTEALRLEPDNTGNVMLLSNLGMLNYYVGADTAAVYYLSLAHDMAPESITILSNRARVYKGVGSYKRAISDYETITRLDSTLYRPYLELGTIYLLTGEMESAREALGKMSKLTDTSKSKECTAALAWLSTVDGDNADAIKQYSILILDEPTADLYAARAMCHIALEHYIEASEDIAEGMKLDENCSELYVARACLNRRTYLNDDALRDAQRAVELGADSRRVKSLLEL